MFVICFKLQDKVRHTINMGKCKQLWNLPDGYTSVPYILLYCLTLVLVIFKALYAQHALGPGEEEGQVFRGPHLPWLIWKLSETLRVSLKLTAVRASHIIKATSRSSYREAMEFQRDPTAFPKFHSDRSAYLEAEIRSPKCLSRTFPLEPALNSSVWPWVFGPMVEMEPDLQKVLPLVPLRLAAQGRDTGRCKHLPRYWGRQKRKRTTRESVHLNEGEQLRGKAALGLLLPREREER